MKRIFALTLSICLFGTTAYAADNREKVQAIPVQQKVVLEGQEVVMEGYNINGNTYFRLREVALNITRHIDNWRHHFHVYYDKDLK